MIKNRNPISFKAHSFQISLASNDSNVGEFRRTPYLQIKLGLGLRVFLFITDQASVV
jgi:hypothetical protein